MVRIDQLKYLWLFIPVLRFVPSFFSPSFSSFLSSKIFIIIIIIIIKQAAFI